MGDATKRIVAIVVGVPFVFVGATFWVAAQPEPIESKVPEPRKNYAEEYHPTLKDNAKQISDLLTYGPDAPACVKFEPAGLHITLPLGYPKNRPGTGVITDFGVKGDFEVTIAFEIPPGKNLPPPTNYATLRLWVVPHEPAEPEVWHKANQNRAGLGREITGRDGAGRFHANAFKFNPDVPRDKWGNENFSKTEVPTDKRFATSAPSGRLRLVRKGADLIFSTSEDADKEFKFLYKDDFGTKDLKNVRILAATGGTGDAIDILVTDLHIRADAFVKGAVAPPPQPVAEPRSLAIPIAVGSAILVVLVLLLGGGAWLFLRNSRVAPSTKSAASDALIFACSQCGKKIKAKADRAGKTLKCPHCGNAVKAPHQGPDDAEEAP